MGNRNFGHAVLLSTGCHHNVTFSSLPSLFLEMIVWSTYSHSPPSINAIYLAVHVHDWLAYDTCTSWRAVYWFHFSSLILCFVYSFVLEMQAFICASSPIASIAPFLKKNSPFLLL